ncbi:MAG: Fe-S cluster assembly protein SufB [Candidatus Beckwithbacteria bacterium]|nr:Fe-S cluster assembly protein SufB [Candidatus Beckwithbacteria bacterium]
MTILDQNLIKKISKQKKEPGWMLELRLKALKSFQEKPMPNWGVDLSGLDFEKINYFSEPEDSPKRSWNQVPRETKDVFEKLGVPEQERKILAGVGAQWNSTIIYQKLKEKLENQGVIFCPMEEAVKRWPDLVKQYFMTKAVTINNNKFSSLNGAIWSGGVFVYVPEGVVIKEPLQGFFWLNLRAGGQFEHTIIVAEEKSRSEFIEGCSAPVYQQDSLHSGVVEIFVGKRARVKFSTIQNWSKNVYNLGTKRAMVAEDGVMEWVSVSLGSQATMVYPASILIGDGAKTSQLSLSLAGKGQEMDTGGKAIHIGKKTTSNIVSKSISKDGGKASYRGLVKILPGAKRAKSSVNCESLLLDNKSQAKTYPSMEILEDDVTALHEAKTGKIAEEELFYLMSRGLSEQEATSLIINGFIEPVVKNLPLEYAVEINRLIDLYAEH